MSPTTLPRFLATAVLAASAGFALSATASPAAAEITELSPTAIDAVSYGSDASKLPEEAAPSSLASPEPSDRGDRCAYVGGCEASEADEPDGEAEEPPMDGCTTETPCGPEDEWADFGDGCYFHNDHVYCPNPGEEPSPESDPQSCTPVEGQVECPTEPDEVPEPECPMTRVSEDCAPSTSTIPEDEPTTPDTSTADNSGKSGLPVTGPGLALLVAGGTALTAAGGALLLLRRRGRDGEHHVDAP